MAAMASVFSAIIAGRPAGPVRLGGRRRRRVPHHRPGHPRAHPRRPPQGDRPVAGRRRRDLRRSSRTSRRTIGPGRARGLRRTAGRTADRGPRGAAPARARLPGLRPGQFQHQQRRPEPVPGIARRGAGEDQGGAARTRSRRERSRLTVSSSRAAGRTRNVAPSPGALSTLTVPPWAATKRRTIDRPSPAAAALAGARLVGAVEPLENPRCVLVAAIPVRYRPPRRTASCSVVPTRTVTSASAGCARARCRPDCRAPAAAGPRHRSLRASRVRPDSSPIVRSGATARAVVYGVRRNRTADRPGLFSSGRWASSRASMQQILDQQPHPRRLALDPAHQHLRIVMAPCRYSSAKPRIVVERRAQLVARVGDEPAHLLLGPPRRLLRRLGRGERVLDLREHSVERHRQSTDLGAVVPLRHPPVQVAGGDGSGGLLHLDQRPQTAPDHEVRAARRARSARQHRCRVAARSAGRRSPRFRQSHARWSWFRPARVVVSTRHCTSEPSVEPTVIGPDRRDLSDSVGCGVGLVVDRSAAPFRPAVVVRT